MFDVYTYEMDVWVVVVGERGRGGRKNGGGHLSPFSLRNGNFHFPACTAVCCYKIDGFVRFSCDRFIFLSPSR